MSNCLSVSTKLGGLRIFIISVCSIYLWNLGYSLIFSELLLPSTTVHRHHFRMNHLLLEFRGSFTTGLLKLFLQENSNISEIYYYPKLMILRVETFDLIFLSFDLLKDNLQQSEQYSIFLEILSFGLFIRAMYFLINYGYSNLYGIPATGLVLYSETPFIYQPHYADFFCYCGIIIVTVRFISSAIPIVIIISPII